MGVKKDLKILVVEDNEKIRKLLCNLLKNIGFTAISEAENGKLAWDKLHAYHYDLLLTDWQMPVMDGMELLKMIRRDSYLKELPVMMITASDSQEQIVEAAKHKVNGYIVKPFSVKTIVEKIDKVFANRG
ncbi:MAG: response regulator [SAR324 cluster bacterium]|nr:response regulator [SAR324 cluster bacterium]